MVKRVPFIRTDTVASVLGSLVRRPVLFAALGCFAAGLYACSGAPSAGTQGAGEPQGQLPFKKGTGASSCVDLHSLEECGEYFAKRHQIVLQLDEVEAERDVRNVRLGLDAIATHDALFAQSGLRIVGPFPEEKGVVDAVRDALLSPYTQSVGPLAAALAEREPTLERLGTQWKLGHQIAEEDSERRDDDPGLAEKGFTLPSGAVPYPIGDSTVSAAFMVDAAAPTVMKLLGVPELTLDVFATQFVAGAAPTNDTFRARIDEAVKNRDDKALQAIEKEYQAALTSAQPLAIDALPFPRGDVRDAARGFILEGKEHDVARWAVVYREPIYDKTILMLGWTSRKGPPRHI